MKLTIALEAHFFQTPDQIIWADSGPDYYFWRRYLDVFDAVEIVARVQDISSVPQRSKRADGERVKFIRLPSYIGPYQYFRNAIRVDEIVEEVVDCAEAVLLRTPGQISNRIFHYVKKNRHPYAVEVVGDPYDVFAPGTVDHPLRRFFRWWYSKLVKDQCEGALAASYVTQKTLQKRYPNPGYSTHYSSIDIREDAYVTSPKVEFGTDGSFCLVLIGSLAQLYKAPDILIDAVASCRARGFQIKLKVIGDGKFRQQLEDQVTRLGLRDSIKFLGQLPAGDAVRNELLQADLFILPSRTEGLPRAMIEAMACGLPCIGTQVGGIPELLPPDDLVLPGNVEALAAKIEEVITKPERMRAMSVRNLERSMAFRNDILGLRRREFYNYLRQKTEFWLQEKKA